MNNYFQVGHKYKHVSTRSIIEILNIYTVEEVVYAEYMKLSGDKTVRNRYSKPCHAMLGLYKML